MAKINIPKNVDGFEAIAQVKEVLGVVIATNSHGQQRAILPGDYLYEDDVVDFTKLILFTAAEFNQHLLALEEQLLNDLDEQIAAEKQAQIARVEAEKKAKAESDEEKSEEDKKLQEDEGTQFTVIEHRSPLYAEGSETSGLQARINNLLEEQNHLRFAKKVVDSLSKTNGKSYADDDVFVDLSVKPKETFESKLQFIQELTLSKFDGLKETPDALNNYYQSITKVVDLSSIIQTLFDAPKDGKINLSWPVIIGSENNPHIIAAGTYSKADFFKALGVDDLKSLGKTLDLSTLPTHGLIIPNVNPLLIQEGLLKIGGLTEKNSQDILKAFSNHNTDQDIDFSVKITADSLRAHTKDGIVGDDKSTVLYDQQLVHIGVDAVASGTKILSDAMLRGAFDDNFDNNKDTVFGNLNTIIPIKDGPLNGVAINFASFFEDIDGSEARTLTIKLPEGFGLENWSYGGMLTSDVSLNNLKASDQKYSILEQLEKNGWTLNESQTELTISLDGKSAASLHSLVLLNTPENFERMHLTGKPLQFEIEVRSNENTTDSESNTTNNQLVQRFVFAGEDGQGFHVPESWLNPSNTPSVDNIITTTVTDLSGNIISTSTTTTDEKGNTTTKVTFTQNDTTTTTVTDSKGTIVSISTSTTAKNADGSTTTTTETVNGNTTTTSVTTKDAGGSTTTTTTTTETVSGDKTTISVIVTDADGNITSKTSDEVPTDRNNKNDKPKTWVEIDNYDPSQPYVPSNNPNVIVTTVVTNKNTNTEISTTKTTTGTDGTTTTTVKNSDGTTTTTVDVPNGTTTTTVTDPNGPTTTIVSVPNGTTTTTVKDPDGTTTTTVNDPKGNTTTTVTDPNGNIITRNDTDNNPAGNNSDLAGSFNLKEYVNNADYNPLSVNLNTLWDLMKTGDNGGSQLFDFASLKEQGNGSLKITLTDIGDPKELPTLKLSGVSPDPTFVKVGNGYVCEIKISDIYQASPTALKIIPSAFDSHDFRVSVDVVSSKENVPSIKLLSDSLIHVGVQAQGVHYTAEHTPNEGSVYTFGVDKSSIQFFKNDTVSLSFKINAHLQDVDGSESHTIKVYLPTGAEKSAASWGLGAGADGWQLSHDARGPYVEYHGAVQNGKDLTIPVTLDAQTYAALQKGQGGSFNIVWDTLDKDSDSNSTSRVTTDTANAKDSNGNPLVVIDGGLIGAPRGLAISEVQDTYKESDTIPVPLGALFTQIKYLLNNISPVIAAKIADPRDTSIKPDATKVTGAASASTKEVGDINNRLNEIFKQLGLKITQTDIDGQKAQPITLKDDNGRTYSFDVGSGKNGTSDYNGDTLFKLFKDFLVTGSPVDYSARLEPAAHTSVGFDLKFELTNTLQDINADMLKPVSQSTTGVTSYSTVPLPKGVVLDNNPAHKTTIDNVKLVVEQFNKEAGSVRISIDAVATDVQSKLGLTTASWTEYAKGVSSTGDLKLIEKQVTKELPLFQIKDDTVHMPLTFKVYAPERDGTESLRVKFTLPDGDSLLKAKDLGKVSFEWMMDSPNNGWSIKNTEGVVTIERDISGNALKLLEQLNNPAITDSQKAEIKLKAGEALLQEIEGLKLEGNQLVSTVPVSFDRDMLEHMTYKPINIGMSTTITDDPGNVIDDASDNIKNTNQQLSFNYDKRFLDPTLTEFSFDPETFGEKELELAVQRHQVIGVDLREMILQIDAQYKELSAKKINENGDSIKTKAELEQAQAKFFENTKIYFETFTSGGEFPEGKHPIAFFNTTPVTLEVSNTTLTASGAQLKLLYESIVKDPDWAQNLDSLPKLYLASAPYYDKDFSINATSYVNGKLDNEITLLETKNYTVDAEAQSALDLELGGARELTISPRMEFQTVSHSQNPDLFDLAGSDAQTMRAVKFTFDVTTKFPDTDGSESHWIVVRIDTSKLLYPPVDAQGNPHPKAGEPIGNDFEATSYIFQKENSLWDNYGHGVFARRIDKNTQEDFDESFSFEVPLSMVPIAVQEGHSSLYKVDEYGHQVKDANGNLILADDVFGIKFDLSTEEAGYSKKGVTDFELNNFDNISATHIEKSLRIETIGIDERTDNDTLTNAQRKALASDEGQWKVADVSFEGAMRALWEKFSDPLSHLEETLGINSDINDIVNSIRSASQADQAIYQQLLNSKIEISVGLVDKLHLPQGFFESVDAQFSYDGNGHYILTGNALATALVQWNNGEDQIITDINGDQHTVPHLEPTMYFRTELYSSADFSVAVKAYTGNTDKPFYNPSDILVIVDGEAQGVNPNETPAGATARTGIQTNLSFLTGSDGELNGQANLNVRVNINLLDHDSSEDVEVTLTLHGNLPFDRLLLLQAPDSNASWTRSLDQPNVFTARVPANSLKTLSDSFMLKGNTADFISSDTQGASVSGEQLTFDMRVVTHEKIEDYQVHGQANDPNAVLTNVSTISTQQNAAITVNAAKNNDVLVDLKSSFSSLQSMLKNNFGKEFFSESTSVDIKLRQLELPTSPEDNQTYTIQVALPNEYNVLRADAPKDLIFKWLDNENDAWTINGSAQSKMLAITLSADDIKAYNASKSNFSTQAAVKTFLDAHPHFNNLLDSNGDLSVKLSIPGEMGQYLDRSNDAFENISITSTISKKSGADSRINDDQGDETAVTKTIQTPEQITYSLTPTIKLQGDTKPASIGTNDFPLKLQVNLDFNSIHDTRPVEVKIPLPLSTDMLSNTSLGGTSAVTWTVPSNSGWKILNGYVVKEFTADEINQIKLTSQQSNNTSIDFPTLNYKLADERSFDYLNDIANLKLDTRAEVKALPPSSEDPYTNNITLSLKVDLAEVSATQSVTIRMALPPTNDMLKDNVPSDSSFAWKTQNAQSGWVVDAARNELVKTLSVAEVAQLKAATQPTSIDVPLSYTSRYADDVEGMKDLSFTYTATAQESPIVQTYKNAADISENSLIFTDAAEKFLEKVHLTFDVSEMKLIGNTGTGELPKFEKLPEGFVLSADGHTVRLEGDALKNALSDWLQLHDSNAPVPILLNSTDGTPYYFNGSLQYDDIPKAGETVATHVQKIFDEVDIRKIGQEAITVLDKNGNITAEYVSTKADLTKGFVDLYREFVEPHKAQMAFSLEDQMKVLQSKILQALGPDANTAQIDTYLKNLSIDLRLEYGNYESKPATLQLIKNSELSSTVFGEDASKSEVIDLNLVQSGEFINIPVTSDFVMVEGRRVDAKPDGHGGKYVSVRDSFYQISGEDLSDIYHAWAREGAGNNNFASVLINGYAKPFTLDTSIINTAATDDRGNPLSISERDYSINKNAVGQGNLLSLNDMVEVLHPELSSASISIKLDSPRDLIKPPEVSDTQFEKVFLGTKLNEKGESVNLYEYQLKGEKFTTAFHTWLESAMTSSGGFNAAAKFTTDLKIYQTSDFTIDASVDKGFGPNRESTALYSDTIVQVGQRDDIVVSAPDRETFNYVKEADGTEPVKVKLDLSEAFKLLAEKFVVNNAFSPENILNSEIRIAILGGGKVDGEGPNIVSPGVKKLDATSGAARLGFDEWVMTNPDVGKQGQTTTTATSHANTGDILGRFQTWLRASGEQKEAIQKAAATVELQLNEHRDEDIAVRYKLTFADGGDPVAFRPDQFIAVDAVINGAKNIELDVAPPDFVNSDKSSLAGLFKVSYTVKMDFPDTDNSEKHLIQLEIYNTQGELIDIPFKIFKDSMDLGWQRGPNNTILFDPSKIDVSALPNGHFEKTLDLRFDINDLVNKGYLDRSTNGEVNKLNFIANVKVTSTENTSGLQVNDLQPLEQSLLKLPQKTSLSEFIASSKEHKTETTVRFGSVNESLVGKNTVDETAVPAAQRLRDYYEKHIENTALDSKVPNHEVGIVNISSIYSKINTASTEILKNDQWFSMQKVLNDLNGYKKDNPTADLSAIKISLNLESLNPKALNAAIDLPGFKQVDNNTWEIDAKTLMDKMQPNGLKAEYYNGNSVWSATSGLNLSPSVSPLSTKLDAQVNFSTADKNFGETSTMSGIADVFSARWTGQLLADKAGAYQFQIKADPGSIVEVWVNGVKTIASATVPTSGLLASVTSGIQLQANTKYNIDVRYVDSNGGADGIILNWKEPGASSFVTIPNDHLFAPVDYPANPLHLSVDSGSVSGIVLDVKQKNNNGNYDVLTFDHQDTVSVPFNPLDQTLDLQNVFENIRDNEIHLNDATITLKLDVSKSQVALPDYFEPVTGQTGTYSVNLMSLKNEYQTWFGQQDDSSLTANSTPAFLKLPDGVTFTGGIAQATVIYETKYESNQKSTVNFAAYEELETVESGKLETKADAGDLEKSSLIDRTYYPDLSAAIQTIFSKVPSVALALSGGTSSTTTSANGLAAYILGAKTDVSGKTTLWKPADGINATGFSLDTAKPGTTATESKAFAELFKINVSIGSQTGTLDLDRHFSEFQTLARAYETFTKSGKGATELSIYQAATKSFIDTLAAGTDSTASAAQQLKITMQEADLNGDGKSIPWTPPIVSLTVTDKFNATNYAQTSNTAGTVSDANDVWNVAASYKTAYSVGALPSGVTVSQPIASDITTSSSFVKSEAYVNLEPVVAAILGKIPNDVASYITGTKMVNGAKISWSPERANEFGWEIDTAKDNNNVQKAFAELFTINLTLNGTATPISLDGKASVFTELVRAYVSEQAILNNSESTPEQKAQARADFQAETKEFLLEVAPGVIRGYDNTVETLSITNVSIADRFSGTTPTYLQDDKKTSSQSDDVWLTSATTTPRNSSISTQVYQDDYYQTTMNLKGIFDQIKADPTHTRAIITINPENIPSTIVAGKVTIDPNFLKAFEATNDPAKWQVKTGTGSLYADYSTDANKYSVDIHTKGDITKHTPNALSLNYEVQKLDHITLDDYDAAMKTGGEGIQYHQLTDSTGTFDLQGIFKAISENPDYSSAGATLKIQFNETSKLEQPLPSYLKVEGSSLTVLMDSTAIKNLYTTWQAHPNEGAFLPNLTINTTKISGVNASLTYEDTYEAENLTSQVKVLLDNFDSLMATGGKRFDNGTANGVETTPVQQQLWGLLKSNYTENQAEFKKFVIVFESNDPQGPIDSSLIAQATYHSKDGQVYSWLSDIQSVRAPTELGEQSAPNNRYAYEVTLDMKEYQSALDAARADATRVANERESKTTASYTSNPDEYLNDFATTMVNSLFLPVRDGARLSNLSIQAVNEDNQMIDPVTGRLTDVTVAYEDVPVGSAFTEYGKAMGVGLGQVLWDALANIVDKTDGDPDQIATSRLSIATNISTQIVFGKNSLTDWPQDDYNSSSTTLGPDAQKFKEAFANMKLVVPGSNPETEKALGNFSDQEFKNLKPNEYPLSVFFPYSTDKLNYVNPNYTVTDPNKKAENIATTFKDESNRDDWFVDYGVKFVKDHAIDGEMLRVLVNQVKSILDSGNASDKAKFINDTLDLFGIQAPPKTSDSEHGNRDAFVLNVSTRSQVVNDTDIDGGTAKREFVTDTILPDTYIDIVPTENRSLDASSNLSVKIDPTFEDTIVDASGNVIRSADQDASQNTRAKMAFNLDLQFVNRSSELKHGVVIELPRYYVENGKVVSYNWAFVNSPTIHESLQGESTSSQGGRPWNLLDNPDKYPDTVLLHYFFSATTDGRITDTLNLTFDSEVFIGMKNADNTPIQDQIKLYTSNITGEKPVNYYDLSDIGKTGLLAVDSSVVAQDIIKDTTFVAPITLDLNNVSYTTKAGTSADDTYRLTDNSKNTALFTGLGNDTVYGADGNDIIVESRAAAKAGGDDYFALGAGQDIALAGAGNDVIYAHGDKSSTETADKGRGYFIFEGDTLEADQKVSFEIHFEIKTFWEDYYKSYYSEASFSDFPLVTSTHQNTVLDKDEQGNIVKRSTEIVDLISAGSGDDIIYTHNPNADKYHGAFVLAGTGKDTIVSGWGSDVINLSVANGFKMITKQPILTSDFWGKSDSDASTAWNSLGGSEEFKAFLSQMGLAGGFQTIMGNITNGHYYGSNHPNSAHPDPLTAYFHDYGDSNDVFDDEPGNVHTALNAFIAKAHELYDDKYTADSEKVLDSQEYAEVLKTLDMLKDYSDQWAKIETGQQYTALQLTAGDDAITSLDGRDTNLKQSDSDTDVIRYYLDSVVKDVNQDNPLDFAGQNRSFDTIYYFDTNKDTGDKIDLSGFFNELFEKNKTYHAEEQSIIDSMRNQGAGEGDIVKAVSAMRFDLIKVIGEDFQNDLLEVSNKDRMSESVANTVSEKDVELSAERIAKSARIVVTDSDADETHTTQNSDDTHFRYDIALLVNITPEQLKLDNFILYTPQDLQ